MKFLFGSYSVAVAFSLGGGGLGAELALSYIADGGLFVDLRLEILEDLVVFPIHYYTSDHIDRGQCSSSGPAWRSPQSHGRFMCLMPASALPFSDAKHAEASV